MTEEAWFQSLQNLNDADGIEAFASVMRSGASIYGDVEPGHIIDRAEQLAAARMLRGGEDWIAKAPSNPDDPDWSRQERMKRYKSTDDDGHVFLIENPSAWRYRELDDGRRVYIRPRPQPTGERILKAEQKRIRQ